VRLLFDQNLSYRLVARPADLFPDSTGLYQLGLAEADDADVWAAARAGGYILVSRDADFGAARRFPGPPPKVIRIAFGTCSVDEVEQALRSLADTLVAFGSDQDRELTLS